jgi:two-component system, NarL family, nitrate/nitrite response regulator NarL
MKGFSPSPRRLEVVLDPGRVEGATDPPTENGSAANDTITVFVASAVRLYSDGIRLLLAREEGISVVGQAESAAAMLVMLDDLAVTDIVLVDTTMPEAVASMQAIHRRRSRAKVVALGVSEVDEVIACAEAGATGYVVRDSGAADLVETVRGVTSGEALCSAQITATLLQRIAGLADQRATPDHEDLTPRQLQVLRLIDEGLSNKEIAARLCIEIATVKSHVHTILEKLGARRRGEAAARMRVANGGAHPRT